MSSVLQLANRSSKTQSYIANFFVTANSITPTIIRVILAIVLLGHGCQKLLGWYGGYGFENTMIFFTDKVGLPWIVGFLVIVIEFVGSLLLLVGFAARFWGIAITILMAGVALTSHIQNGFFINWLGNQRGEGIEFFLLAMAMSVSIAINGAGKFSIDLLIMRTLINRSLPKNITIQF